MAEAVDRASAGHRPGTRHAAAPSAMGRSHRLGGPMGTPGCGWWASVTGSNPGARRGVEEGNAGVWEVLGALSADRPRPGGEPAALSPDRGRAPPVDPRRADRPRGTPPR